MGFRMEERQWEKIGHKAVHRHALCHRGVSSFLGCHSMGHDEPGGLLLKISNMEHSEPDYRESEDNA